MKKLLIGSVFANDSLIQRNWLDLQLKFIQETTNNYDHITMVMSGNGDGLKREGTHVIAARDKSLAGSEAHLHGLQSLRQVFSLYSDEYENFLYIDSDAFPIKKNWLGVLLKAMKPDELIEINGALIPSYAKHYDIAVALRSENLETRLHASILLVKHEVLQEVDFEFGVMGKDLLCNPEKDIYIPLYETERRHLALPLIRTNQLNVHPLSCGIYYDMFYHHACGSRPFSVRCENYFSKITQVVNSTFQTDKLFKSPNEFVSELAGWNPTRYAHVSDV